MLTSAEGGSMSKKHYIAIADILRAAYQGAPTPETRAIVRGLASDLAELIASENAAFDMVRFLTAAGLR